MSHFRNILSARGGRSPDRQSTLFSIPSDLVPHDVCDVSVKVERSMVGTFGVGNVVSSGHDTLVTEPSGATMIIPVRGRITSAPAGGVTQRATSGGALLFSPNRRDTRVEPLRRGPFVGIPIVMPIEEPRETGMELGMPRLALRALDSFALSVSAGSAMQVDELIRIGRTLHDRVLRGDPALLHPSAQSSWTRSLAEALIGVFEALGDLSVPSYADARSAHRHVDRAHDFMLEHYADIAMMAEVADACGISSRTLEAAFRTVWGVRPLQLLASIRLDAVRRDLMDADPTASVNDLALGAGFSHLGRFSLLYRERYGEHPSDTIRRARGA